MRINKSLITQSATGGGGSGTVTSVGLTVSVPTGLSQSVSGSPITTSGTISVSLSFAAGYAIPTTVKQSEWDDAYTWVAAFPTQTGNAGKYLRTDGSNLIWTSLVSPAYGTTGQVQMNNGGDLYANADLYFDIMNSRLGIGVGGTYIHKTLVVHTTSANNQFLLSGTAPGVEFGDNTSGTFTYRAQIGMATSSGHFATNSVAGDLVHWVDTGKNMLWAINSVEKIKLLSTGQLKFAGYTSTSSFTGTAAGYLAFDSSGNILSASAPSGTNIYNSDGTLNGNRTISTTSGFTLTINPNTTFTGNLYLNSTNTYLSGGSNFNIYTGNTLRTTIYSDGAFFNTANNSTTGFYINQIGTGYLLSIAQNDNIKFRVFNTGNVAIANTVDAGYKLDVQGTGRFTGALYLTGGTGVAGTMSYGATYGLLLYGNTGSNADVTITDRTGALRISVVNGGNIIQTSTTISGVSIGSGVVTPSITKGSTYGLTIIGTSATTYDLSLFERTGNNGLFIDSSGQIKIGVYNSTFNSSAILEAVSTTKGFLPPRMTTTNRDAIATPATGLQIYNTTTNANNYYNGTAWVSANGGIPAGSNTEIQYNNSGAFGASSAFTYTDSTGLFSLRKDQNAPTYNSLSNYTSNTSATAAFIVWTSATANGQFGKFSIGATAYKGISANSTYLYHGGGSGNLVLQCDVGHIDMVPGGLSLPKIRVHSNGNVIINSTTDQGYSFQVSGSVLINNYIYFLNNIYFGRSDMVIGTGNTNAAAIRSGSTINFAPNAVWMSTMTDAGMSIGTSSNPNASSILDLTSTTKGFLPPRMTNAQRTAISSPAVGLIVYCTDATEGLYVYKSGGWTFVI